MGLLLGRLARFWFDRFVRDLSLPRLCSAAFLGLPNSDSYEEAFFALSLRIFATLVQGASLRKSVMLPGGS